MARQKGMLNLSGNLEPLAGAPLDSRDITPTVADLYIASNWPYKYIGMKTTVTATGDTYRLVNLDVTQESSWVKEGSGESNLSDLNDVDLINPEEGETLIYDGEGGWTNGPAGQTYSDFTGATAQAAGAHGLVPAPTTGDISKFLKGDGTWAEAPGGSGSEVEANPIGEPYETIYTIKINNDIYVIPQGGGSGGYVYTTMPACTSLDLGKVAQYVGATDDEYTKGFFYECVYTDNPYAYLVPIMTSATTPSGVVFCSGQGAGFEAYKVFGRDNNNRAWSLRNDNNPCWCGYQFNARTLVTDVDIYNYNRSDHQSAFEMPKTIEFQGSDDGINYTTIQTFTIPTTVKDQKNSFSINDPSRYVYYRFYCTEFNDQTYCTMGRIDMFLYTGNYKWQKINVQ